MTHCGHDHHGQPSFDGMSSLYRRILIGVAAINFIMFLVEIIGGQMAKSMALQADALDFFADGLTYTLSFLVIGRAVHVRSLVATLKGISLALMGLYIFGMTIYRTFYLQTPEAYTMGAIGVLALAVNAISVLLLYRWRNGDANVRSVWLCSRNDAIGNVAVMAAAAMVAWLNNGWPDVIVAGIMAVLFLSSATQIVRQAWHEYAHSKHIP